MISATIIIVQVINQIKVDIVRKKNSSQFSVKQLGPRVPVTIVIGGYWIPVIRLCPSVTEVKR